jgi:hypothetical protein
LNRVALVSPLVSVSNSNQRIEFSHLLEDVMPRRDNEKLSRLSRRDFARAIAVTAASVAVPHKAPANVLDFTQDAAAQALSPAGEAQFQTILAKYGKRLSDEQKADVRRLVGQAQKAGEVLRAFPLDNSDEPATIFHVYRADRR